jgi:hypothetical protein
MFRSFLALERPSGHFYRLGESNLLNNPDICVTKTNFFNQ